MKHRIILLHTLLLSALILNSNASASSEQSNINRVALHNSIQNKDIALPKKEVKSTRKFDAKSALQFSQQAIGKQLLDYSLLDRHGKVINLSKYRGKPLLISFIYSSCFNTCPIITEHLQQAVKTARSAVGNKSFNIVSIGFDTRHDKPETMNAFARQHGVSNDPAWNFLSASNKQDIKKLSKNLGFFYRKSLNGFDHLAQVTIIDSNGLIYRQVYGEVFSPPTLVEPLKELIFNTPSFALIDISHLINKARLWCTLYDPKTNTYRFNYTMLVGLVINVIILSIIGYFIIRLWIKTFNSNDNYKQNLD